MKLSEIECSVSLNAQQKETLERILFYAEKDQVEIENLEDLSGYMDYMVKNLDQYDDVSKIVLNMLRSEIKKAATRRTRVEKKDDPMKKTATAVSKTAAGTIGREVGNNVGKSLGGKFGKRLGGNIGAELARSIVGNIMK